MYFSQNDILWIESGSFNSLISCSAISGQWSEHFSHRINLAFSLYFLFSFLISSYIYSAFWPFMGHCVLMYILCKQLYKSSYMFIVLFITFYFLLLLICFCKLYGDETQFITFAWGHCMLISELTVTLLILVEKNNNRKSII